ncbi:MAG: FliG C-terminal domain-containing protein [Bacteriovoracaceae bacterium]
MSNQAKLKKVMEKIGEENKVDGAPFSNLLTIVKDIDKIAILLNILDQNTLKSIFQHLSDYDVAQLVQRMHQVKRTPISVVNNVLNEVYEILSEQNEFIFTEFKSKNVYESLLGKDRFKNIYGENKNLDKELKLEALDLVDDKMLANFLTKEHPQTIALIMAFLKTPRMSSVLKLLPEKVHPEIVERIAKLDSVSPTDIHNLDTLLKNEFMKMGLMSSAKLGGNKVAAEIINALDPEMSKRILSRISEKDEQKSNEISLLLFTFEDLLKIPKNEIAIILKEVDQTTLLKSLKISSPELVARFTIIMSKNKKELFLDDLKSLPPMKKSEVIQAQQKVIELCNKLKEKGKLTLSFNGDDDLVC